MNKILVAFDDQHFSKGAMELLLRLCTMQPVKVVGVFLPPSEGEEAWSYEEPVSGSPVLLHPLKETETKILEHNVALFGEMLHPDIPYRVHKEFHDQALPELIKESCFADLLVIGNEVFFEDPEGSDEEGANSHLKDILFRAQCPVLLAPERFVCPSTNIIAYDGSESSVYAIKQFAYLFPEWCKHRTEIVYIAEEGMPGLPDQEYIKELVSGYFPDASFCILPAGTRGYLGTRVNEQRDALLICGAFGRSVISETIRKSFVADAICEHKLPIFTAHR